MTPADPQHDTNAPAPAASLDRKVVPSILFTSGERDPTAAFRRPAAWSAPGAPTLYMMGDDPRLSRMPERPTLFDFFRQRFAAHTVTHLLQSASHARRSGQEDKVVLACLLHDIAVAGFVRGDHGYYGAQLVRRGEIRRAAIIFFTLAFLAAGVAGLFGAFITKAAAVA